MLRIAISMRMCVCFSLNAYYLQVRQRPNDSAACFRSVMCGFLCDSDFFIFFCMFFFFRAQSKIKSIGFGTCFAQSSTHTRNIPMSSISIYIYISLSLSCSIHTYSAKSCDFLFGFF